MSPKGSCLQSLGTFRKLIGIIMRSLEAQKYKTVTLGVSAQQAFPGIHSRDGCDPNPTDDVETGEDHKMEVDKGFNLCVDGGDAGEDEGVEPGEQKLLKKAVSFHDEVEKIEPARKRVIDNNEHLPLKPILKVASKKVEKGEPNRETKTIHVII
ncbi:hypothetical protein SAY87_012474 [Trapa incisa]|uniref:Uncharacterized protein n=1 Tax=Trapa incisa TaxID=236973 RepID=A0AAN7GTF4_9MYRT|nr:hypothetical protein SAY87_012474 [Trapa incisa]